MSGELKKLIVESYKSDGYGQSDKIGEFVAMFNPNQFTLKYEVDYERQNARGTSSSPLPFQNIKPREFTLELHIDGTGLAAELTDVAEKVNSFLQVAAEYNGDIHRTPYLKVVWGAFVSKCVLKAADVAFTLFKPDGSPLRGKITATFMEAHPDRLRARSERANSPDLTHVRQAKAGDTLPWMTHGIYKTPDYYVQIAQVNDLDNFRKLKPGQQLRFPPVRSEDN
jgi:Contractile injection system tube protein